MPDRPQPADWGPPPFGDWDLDELARSSWGVEEIMTALRAGPGHAELTGETRALAEFRRVHRRPRHRRRRRTVPVTRLAAAAALIAVAACGAVAETGRLPTPIQNLAHEVFAAPNPLHLPPVHGRASGYVSPGVSWSHACQDYQQEVAADRMPWQEPGYRALVSAAHGSEHVNSYCNNGDFPRGTSYPGQLSEADPDQPPQSRASGSRAGASPSPASGYGGVFVPGKGGVFGGASPGVKPSMGPGGEGPGMTPAPGDTPGPGGGSSPGGKVDPGSYPSPAPSSYYPGPGFHYPGPGP